jgi:hypothetical protein
LFAQQPSSIVLLPNWKYNKKERDAPASLYVYNTCGGGVFTMLCILDLSHHWLKGFAGERICCRGDKRGARVKTFLVLFLMKQQLEISGRRRSCRDERRRRKKGGGASLFTFFTLDFTGNMKAKVDEEMMGFHGDRIQP